jgi:catechol 2,3-dioxygenase-like lactoylglutathione lyase family enzyme
VSSRKWFIHHIGVFASDHAASRAFYTAALAPLGIRIGYQADGVAEYWHPERDTPSLSLEITPDSPMRGLHIAFAAPGRAAVDAFHAAAVAAGGVSRLPAGDAHGEPTLALRAPGT